MRDLQLFSVCIIIANTFATGGNLFFFILLSWNSWSIFQLSEIVQLIEDISLYKCILSKKRRILVGQEKVYDQDLLYGRVIRVLVSSRDINFDDVPSCELAAYLPSLFRADGQLKISKSKSIRRICN